MSNDGGIDRLVVLGYVSALGMPPLGLILAMISAVRGSRHWIGIVAVSLVATAVWIAVIASGGLTATNMSY